MTIVRMEDCRALRYCSAGCRRFAQKHNLDFMDFVRNGIPSEHLPTEDIMITALVEKAKEREASNG